MAKTIMKLFRDQEVVSLAVKKLKEESLDKNLGVIARYDMEAGSQINHMKHLKLKINGRDITVFGGPVSSLEASGTGEETEELLRSGLSLSKEGFGYYMDAVGAGGMLLSVEAEGEEAKKVWNILKQAESSQPAAAGSPTFYQASRMAATNSMDAAMSGDFRKY